MIFEPCGKLKEATQHTHLHPESWQVAGAHSAVVRTEFANMFAYRLVVFLEEILSVFLTPYVLWFILPRAAPEIATFFADNTETQPGLGDVCRFALFKGNGDDKMESSMMHFKQMHPSWGHGSLV